MLTGTAAASIAAIASARGTAIAASGDGSGFDLGYGDLDGGAFGGFTKGPGSFAVFMKFHNAGAEVFFKTVPVGVGDFQKIQVFQKTFAKGWSPLTSFFLEYLSSLEGAEASFAKFDKQRADFFIKLGEEIVVSMTIDNLEDGVNIQVTEPSSD